VRRLREAGLSGRTIVLKVRRYDFSTLTRSETLRGPTDDVAVVREAAARLLESVDTTGGVRLLGVGVSGLADYTQEDLFAQAAGEREVEPAQEAAPEAVEEEPEPAERHWRPGQDVRHAVYGHGWVQGSGLGRVTVRFETPGSEPGRVRTFRVDEGELSPAAQGGAAASGTGSFADATPGAEEGPLPYAPSAPGTEAPHGGRSVGYGA
jgi:DNA polymerase-4